MKKLLYLILTTFLAIGALSGCAGKNGMQALLCDKTKEELQNEAIMLDVIKGGTNDLIRQLQTEKIGLSIEYAYLPLSKQQDNPSLINVEELEQRTYPHGTWEDYRSLLTLKTPNYRELSVADFNNALIAWANENHERMERIGEDTARNDFQVALTEEELSFVKLTVVLSGMENGEYVQSLYTGRAEEPISYDEYLPEKAIVQNGMAAWCDLYYRFFYTILDKSAVTVGDRDRQIEEMINAVRAFWNDTDIEDILKMRKNELINRLKKIAADCSTEKINITLEENSLHFERIDERNLEEKAVQDTDAYTKLMEYKADDYTQLSIAQFDNMLEEDYPAFSDAFSAVLANILPDDKNYDFIMTTLSASVSEIYYKHVEKNDVTSVSGTAKKHARPLEPLPGEELLFETQDPIYHFNFYGNYWIQYTVPDPSALTVGERDEALRTIHKGMQDYVENLSESELTGDSIKELLAEKAAKLAESVSSDRIRVTCILDSIEVDNDETGVVNP